MVLDNLPQTTFSVIDLITTTPPTTTHTQIPPKRLHVLLKHFTSGYILLPLHVSWYSHFLQCPSLPRELLLIPRSPSQMPPRLGNFCFTPSLPQLFVHVSGKNQHGATWLAVCDVGPPYRQRALQISLNPQLSHGAWSFF